MADFTRRDLVRSLGLLACTPALGCARRIDVHRVVEVAAPTGGMLTVARAQAPELAHTGGAVVLHPRGLDRPVLLANAGLGFIALGARCPHAGCELAWVHQDREAECPCHGSRFAADGAVLQPPAQEDVDSYQVTVDATTGDLVVHFSKYDDVYPAVSDGRIVFPISDHPQLLAIRGAVLGRPRGLEVPLLTIRIGEAEVIALDATCTHQGCTTRANPEGIYCPCHGSRFTQRGTVQHGPATRNLTTFPVAFDGATVVVSVG